MTDEELADQDRDWLMCCHQLNEVEEHVQRARQALLRRNLKAFTRHVSALSLTINRTINLRRLRKLK